MTINTVLVLAGSVSEARRLASEHGTWFLKNRYSTCRKLDFDQSPKVLAELE